MESKQRLSEWTSTMILARAGGRVGKRKHCPSTIEVHQKVSQTDAVSRFKNRL